MNSNGIVENKGIQLGNRDLSASRVASPEPHKQTRNERVDVLASGAATPLEVDEVEIRFPNRGLVGGGGTPGTRPVTPLVSLTPPPRSQGELNLPRGVSPAAGGGAEARLSASSQAVICELQDNHVPVREVSHDRIVGALRAAVIEVREVQPPVLDANNDDFNYDVPPIFFDAVEDVVRVGAIVGGFVATLSWLGLAFSSESGFLALGGLIMAPGIFAAGVMGAYLVLGAALFIILPAAAIGTVHLVKKTIKGALWLLKQPTRLINWVATQREQRREVQHENASLEELGHSHNRQQNCPISGGRLANPVISPYGITYSRDSISEVLRQQGEASLIDRFKTNRGMEAKLEGHPVQCCVSLEEFDAPALSEDRSFPVVASDGHTYDYRTLVELKSHHQASQRGRARNQIRPMLSPVTKEELEPQVLFQWALMSADECQELARLLPAGATCRPLSLDAPPTELTQYWRDIPQP